MKLARALQQLRPTLPFLLPNLLGFLFFMAGPILVSLYLSLTSWDALAPPRWVGLGNFITLLGFHLTPQGWRANDPEFWQYLGNTLFMLIALPLNLVGSLALAMVLNQRLRFIYTYRLVFFLPSILYGAAIFYLWKYMFDADYGVFNALLAKVGLPGLHWLEDARLAKPALIFMGLWATVGGPSMIIYLAGLQNVPEELYEAARMDGAGRWRQFLHVTWPALRPVTFFLFTMGLIAGLQSGFDTAFIMTDGGPYGTTTTLSYYVYLKGYRFFEMGYACSIAWVIFLITFIFAFVQWRRNREVV